MLHLSPKHSHSPFHVLGDTATRPFVVKGHGKLEDAGGEGHVVRLWQEGIQ